MAVKFGMEEGPCQISPPSVQRVAPARGEKPQNWPLSKLNTGRFALRAMLPVRRLEMWANAQPDGRPAEFRWRPLFNAAKFGRRPLLDAVQ